VALLTRNGGCSPSRMSFVAISSAVVSYLAKMAIPTAADSYLEKVDVSSAAVFVSIWPRWLFP
jgi:hypothetical protein